MEENAIEEIMLRFDYHIVKDPEIFMQNRCEAHSDHHYYPSYEAYEARKEAFKMSLNGVWKFSYARNYQEAVKGFESPEYSCSGWQDIRVPGHIQMEGWDAPQYVNVQYPWDGREELSGGEIPELFNPVASYVKYFDVPGEWDGQAVYISFQGIESACVVWCNGEYVGYAEDSFTPSEFELTPYLVKGRNKLAVQVFKWCSGSWCEDQDFYRFSGIFRDVYLFTRPEVHVEDLCIRTLLSDDCKKAEIEVNVKMIGHAKVRSMLKKDGETVFEGEKEMEGSDGFTMKIENPRLWSCEDPFLYRLFLEVYDREGKMCEVTAQEVGIRQIWIENSVIYLNGKRLVFHGVNRHEFSSLTGRCLAKEDVLQDILTIKRNNINAIRTSHYPNMTYFYELCDRYGVYVVDENNMESHGSWDAVERGVVASEKLIPGDRRDFRNMCLDRLNSMYQRDKNHCCVVMWSLGNESYGGTTIQAMADFIREKDEDRPVHYEGVTHDTRYSGASDVHSEMYPHIDKIKEYLKLHRDKPYISCEYAHAMGNSCGALDKYTEYPYEDEVYAGGFIWDYIDQAIRKKNRYGEWFQAYGGDCMERPTDYNFCGNGIVYGDTRLPSSKMQEVKYCYQFIHLSFREGKVCVENRYNFTDTKEFLCVITLKKDGKEIECFETELSVAPGQMKEFSIPFERRSTPGEYVINVAFQLKKDVSWAKRGCEVAFGETIYKVELKEERKLLPLSVVHGTMNLGVRGEEFEVLFSYKYGGLVSYRYAGRELLEETPLPNFWRAPNDNDRGNNMPDRYAQWKIASMYVSAKNPNEKTDEVNGCQQIPDVEEGDGYVKVTYRYYMPTSPASSCSVSYQIYGDGTVETQLTYTPVPDLKDMPEFGMMFRMNADYDRMIWYGNGPDETYEDRRCGAKLGIYERNVHKDMPGYLVPQECANRTGVRWAKIIDEKGRGMLFETVGDEMSFSALPYTPHELENARHAYELPRVHYTVVRAAQQQMGIAGDDAWGARTHPEYLLDVSKLKIFRFRFRGI